MYWVWNAIQGCVVLVALHAHSLCVFLCVFFDCAKTHKLHATHTHTTHTGGAPSGGGDYTSDSGNFIFSTGNNRVCLDVFVFRDNIYEQTEDLTVEVTGFIDSEGNQVPGLSGVTVVRDMATIQIRDLNGEWVCSCVTMATVSERA